MKFVPVTLTPEDEALAFAAATEITTRARRRNYADKRGAERRFQTYNEDRDNMAQSIGAEIAVARHLGLRWNDPKTQTGKASPDVGDRVGVRWTRVSGLYLFDDDPTAHVYFLTEGHSPDYLILGKIEGRDAKVPAYWRGDREFPGWVVPISALVPVFDDPAAAREVPALAPLDGDEGHPPPVHIQATLFD